MSKVNDILTDARQLAKKSKTWADLSNTLFDPIEGLIQQYYPDATERKEFRTTVTYNKLHDLVEKKMDQTGIVEGAIPKKSGKFVVRLPKSLHAALEHEANAEGTSLNQLVLTKLAVQLQSAANSPTSAILHAFGEIRQGYSADRVIADPELDRKFLRRCRELGLAGTDYDLNWKLLNARKSGQMSLLPKTKRYTVRETDEFEYASELAVRHMQLIRDVSLDQIICDPDLASEFDKYAEQLAPGYTPLEYRWLALGLRKAGRLRKEERKIEIPDFVDINKISKSKVTSLPEIAGLYLFKGKDTPVFLSHTDNLRHRLERHMEYSNSRGLPKWLWDEGPLSLSIAEMPGVARATRQIAELLLVKELHPILNIPRKAA